MHIPWDDLLGASPAFAPHVGPANPGSAPARAYDLWIAEDEGQIGGFWASLVEPPTVAVLRALIVHDDWPLHGTLGTFLTHTRQELRQAGVVDLAFVGAERWLLDGLAAHGFVHRESIVTMQKGTWSVPSRGNRQLVVRPATGADLAEMLAIDERAFVPLWRNTTSTLTEHLNRNDYLCVGELQGRIVGYACASLAGRHGHLARLAVHPRFQGQGVGARLLAEAIAFFRRERVYGITLNTQQSNVRARRLYEWFGFVALGREAEVWVSRL